MFKHKCGFEPSGKVVVASCDMRYYQAFSQGLADTVGRLGRDWMLYIIIVGLDRDDSLPTLKFLESDIQTQIKTGVCVFEVNFEDKFEKQYIPYYALRNLLNEHARGNKYLQRVIKITPGILLPLVSSRRFAVKAFETSCALARFLMPDEMFDNIDKLIIVDIDSIFTSSALDDFHADKPLVYVRSDGWSTTLAGIVLYTDMKKQLKYYRRIREAAREHLFKTGLYWGMDQVILDRVYEHGWLESFAGRMGVERDDLMTGFQSLKGDLKWK